MIRLVEIFSLARMHQWILNAVFIIKVFVVTFFYDRLEHSLHCPWFHWDSLLPKVFVELIKFVPAILAIWRCSVLILKNVLVLRDTFLLVEELLILVWLYSIISALNNMRSWVPLRLYQQWWFSTSLKFKGLWKMIIWWLKPWKFLLLLGRIVYKRLLKPIIKVVWRRHLIV